jgi:hypothetical protein
MQLTLTVVTATMAMRMLHMLTRSTMLAMQCMVGTQALIEGLLLNLAAAQQRLLPSSGMHSTSSQQRQQQQDQQLATIVAPMKHLAAVCQ